MGLDMNELENKGDILEYSVLVNQAAADFVSKELQMSIYQLDYEENNVVAPEPLISKLTITPTLKAPFLCIIKLPDGQVGILSDEANEFKPISYEALPSTMRSYIDKKKTTRDKVKSTTSD
jgi:hypothetical protein